MGALWHVDARISGVNRSRSIVSREWLLNEARSLIIESKLSNDHRRTWNSGDSREKRRAHPVRQIGSRANRAPSITRPRDEITKSDWIRRPAAHARSQQRVDVILGKWAELLSETESTKSFREVSDVTCQEHLHNPHAAQFDDFARRKLCPLERF
jgi:hypothetical protein